MKKTSKFLGVLLILILLLGNNQWLAAKKEAPLTILFTHDLHDNLLPFEMDKYGEIIHYGGYARLQTAIQAQRQKDPGLILVDGGDFSMGTLFQTIFSQEAPGLRLMGQMGYDAVTLGNHEFDFRPAGLADCLIAAQASKERLPLLVAGNVSFPTDGSMKDAGSLKDLQKAMNAYGVKEYTVLERNGYRIGVFGIIGYEASSNAPMAGVTFTDPIKQADQIVAKLKEKEKVDLIICLSHSGTVSQQDQSEDVILAQKVPEIDVIVSGHSHSKLEQPITVGDTVICSTGEYGQNLGKIRLEKTAVGWHKIDYRLLPIDESIAADPAIQGRVEQFKTSVQRSYLDDMGMKFDDVLAQSSFSFLPLVQISSQHAEQPLANLIGDAYIYAVKQAEGANYQPIDAAIVPNGTIRTSTVKGNITVADTFNISSLGIGPDKRSGYPLISVYLTGKELKTACEVDASIAPLMSSAQLYMAGLTYTFNPHRMLFNKVTDVALQRADGTREEINDTKLYRVVAGLYSAQMLSIVGEKSFGLLSIVPKTKEGLPVTDFEAQIIKEQNGGSSNELKEWEAIAKYLQSFTKKDGIAQVPSYYNEKQGRKIVNEQKSLSALLAKPNKFTLTAYGIVLIILLLLILLVRFIIVRMRRRKQSPAQMFIKP